jgi:hypothetical protein
MVRTFLKVHTRPRLAYPLGVEVTESSTNKQHIIRPGAPFQEGVGDLVVDVLMMEVVLVRDLHIVVQILQPTCMRVRRGRQEGAAGGAPQIGRGSG